MRAPSLQDVLQVRSSSAVYGAVALHLNVMMYACSFWLTQPLLPYMTARLGVDRITFGYLQSALEVAQIISSLYFGQVIDKLGPRYAMALAQFGTGFAYLLLAAANDTRSLFISRIPSVFMACMLCAQGAIPALATEERRAAALGRLSVSYLIGMIVGSTSSGVLSDLYGYETVGYIAAAISMLMAGASLYAIPTFDFDRLYAKEDSSIRMSKAITMCFRKRLRAIVTLTLIGGLGLSIYKSQLSVIMADHFNIKASQAGFTTAMGAGAAVVTNAVLIGPLQRRFRPQQLILASISALALCFAILTFTRTYQELLVLLVPVSIASTVLYTITAASLSNSVDSDETGTAVSISHSIRSFTGVVAPPIGGTLFTYARLDGVGFASSGLAAIAAFVYMLLTNATVAAAQGAGDHEPAARAHDKKTS